MQNTTAIRVSGYSVTFHRSGVPQYTIVLDADSWADIGCPSDIDLDEYSGNAERAFMQLKHEFPVVH